MPPTRTRAPLLPVAISQSPLLSGPLPDDLFSALVKPLPTITIGFCDPPPSRLIPDRPTVHHNLRRPTVVPSPAPAPAPLGISSKDVIALLTLLEAMETDVATEVQRVRLGIQEARSLVRECREDCKARASARQERRERERRDTKSADDEFWLGV
ncbi:hypothetical protein PYCCODRAFT_1466461 [Trametes coccinea BRFM310]|uniref:Uncharacterized protein n=1 Tax=Trametes coccinea (strain BRFM310) TaxID=1353009 RepID=A0A1Y2IS91_TRAC3|nr:hypothetical protein PYCCODRAFT_1466461 [Trametes coccinea BRFM310]